MKKNQSNSSLRNVREHFPKVESVRDATKPAIIEVTHDDAASKAIKNPLLCAFARACSRKFTADGVIIYMTTSYIVKGKHAVRYHNPETVTREIVSFDRNAGFDEGVYILSAVIPCRRFGVHKSGKQRNFGVPKVKRPRHVTRNVRVLGEMP